MIRQTLLIDADDTLWENNVFFEQTIENFLDLLEPLAHTFAAGNSTPREYGRRVLNETERRNIRQHGYGIRSFGRSLEEAYLKLAGGLARRGTLDRIASLIADLERVPPKILDGVPETLAYLRERHRLILFTKGYVAEQAAKVARSGLESSFDAIEIVPEKDAETYLRLVQQHRVVKKNGWMVGNSPRSDINPALAAGLNAVYIPHHATWELEHAPIESTGGGSAGKLLILPAFRELRQHF